MLSDRLSLALDGGVFDIPETGAIAVIGPRAGSDLSALPADRVRVIARHYPDHAAFEKSGFQTDTRLDGPYALSIVSLPRAKAEARQVLAQAAAVTNGPLVVDGQKTDGVDSLLKDLRKRGTVGQVLSKAHGKIFAVTDADLADWATQHLPPVEGRFHTAPGVFSADGVDPASAELAKALPLKLKGHVVDLGAGWGYLSDAVLSRDGVAVLDLVEADHVALDCARRNIDDARARFHWADALAWRPDGPVDHVVTNPPFHQGRAADASLGQGFIQAAASMLKPKGTLWLVANRHLPYEKTLEAAFKDVKTVGQTSSFKLFGATAPRSPRKG